MANLNPNGVRLHRLPRWAQEEIEALRRRVDSLERPLRSQEPTPTRILHVRGSGIIEEMVPAPFAIRFMLSENERQYLDVRVERELKNPSGVRLTAGLAGALIIRPHASNSAWVYVEDY